MEKLSYPLLCYELDDGSCLGILVGTSYTVVERDIKSVKKTISDYLQRQYKKHDDYPYVSLMQPRIKTMEVKVRPTFSENGMKYPMPNMVKVPVTVVYGPDDSNSYGCHFPLLGKSFFYHDPKQFRSLASHFARGVLESQNPNDLNRLFLYPEPILEEVNLKVNYNREYDWGDNNYQREYHYLSRFAEKYPHSKSARRRRNTFPDAAWELEGLVEELSQKMAQERVNVLLVGDSGTGKSAVLKQAFRKLTTRMKKQGGDMTFWRIMPQRITASSKYLGEWQEKCEHLVEELQSANGTLWVEDIAQLLLMGGMGPEDSVAAFFSTFLRAGQLQMVGEVTPSQLESMRRMLPGFVENFQVFQLKELPEASIFSILDKFSDFSSQNLKTTLSRAAMELAYRLLLRYYPYEKFPGKAVRFLGAAVSESQLEAQTGKPQNISNEDIIRLFSKQTGLPELFLRDDMKLNQQELSDWFTSRVIGQDAAAAKLCEVVKIYKAGLNNPHKPITTLLFAGPTGVGKTASAKALADYFFGKGQKTSPLIRIDMSEFRYPGQITQFIGAGRNVGKLVKEVRERPFAVLLLDEVEKAHPSIFDALLTVLDEGQLVDAYGRMTHFRNVIIIMTSNLGASNQASLGFKNLEHSSVKYMSAIGQHFRPEFVNRIDGLVMFNTLDTHDVAKITHKELAELSQREGFTKNRIKLDFSPAAVAHIQSVGFDERYGARPLQRAIEDRITSTLANWLLGHPNTKDCTLRIDYQAPHITIRKTHLS